MLIRFLVAVGVVWVTFKYIFFLNYADLKSSSLFPLESSKFEGFACGGKALKVFFFFFTS